MDKQFELNSDTQQNIALYRELLDIEVVLVGGGDVLVSGN
jgi:hypothetical protein